MFAVLDVVAEPIIEETESAMVSRPWIFGYVIVGVLVVAAVLVVIKLIVKAKDKKK